MGDASEDYSEFVDQTLSELRSKPWSVLEELPEYTDLPAPEALAKYSFGIWKEVRPDGSLRIVVQTYRPVFLGIGRMSANGFTARSDGGIQPIPEDELWDYI